MPSCSDNKICCQGQPLQVLLKPLTCCQVHVSYLEIYNDLGYDLLDPDREVRGMEDLPRVSVYEDEDGATRLRNLALHPAANEEAALNLVSHPYRII